MNVFHMVVLFSQFLLSLAQIEQSMISAVINRKIIVQYPKGVISEFDLVVCQRRSACSILHKRFWLPPLIKRLCRCPSVEPCPWTWSDTGNQSINLDSRSQLKFCTELSDLPNCKPKQTAVTITTPMESKESELATSHPYWEHKERHKKHNHTGQVSISCKCQNPYYWKPKKKSIKWGKDNVYSVHRYYCNQLTRCTSNQFCGYIRTDIYSTFNRCTCPKDHFCIKRSRSIFQATEMLYDGNSYKGFCLTRKAAQMAALSTGISK